MARKTLDYDEWLLARLKDPSEAAAYLNEYVQDDGEEDFEQLLLVALRNVARAHGMGAVAERAELGRESLYKALSGSGDPRLSTLTAVLDALGLRIRVEAKSAA